MLLRAASVASIALIVGTACRPNLGYPDSADTGEETGADGSDTSVDTSDSSVDTSDSSVDTDTGPQNTTCHPADPMMSSGWTRTYSFTYRGKTGTETHRGQGNGVYSTQMSAQSDSWNVTVRNGCDSQGKALQQGWEGSTQLSGTNNSLPIPLPISQGYTVRATPSAPRAYLPSLSDLRNGAQWQYTYDLRVEDISGSGGFQPSNVPTTGTYTAWPGMQPVTIAGVTYQAFYLTNQYTQDWSRMDMLGTQGLSNVEGYSELWYVEGLGLVKEKTTDLNDPSSIYVEKTLTSFSGLTPVQ